MTPGPCTRARCAALLQWLGRTPSRTYIATGPSFAEALQAASTTRRWRMRPLAKRASLELDGQVA